MFLSKEPKMNKFDYILCSPEIIKKLIPDFLNQIDAPEANITAFDNTDTKKILAITNTKIDDDLPANWELKTINADDINISLRGCVTLRQLVNGIPIPVFLRDTHGHFIGCNPDFTDFMGIAEHDLIGKTVYEVVPFNQAKEYEQRDNELLQRPHIQVYEGQVTRSNGEKKEVIFRKTLLLDEEGNPSAIVGVIIDISKRKIMEKVNWDYKNKLEDMVIERTANLSKVNKQLKNEIELRRHSEDALRESEELFKTIFNSTYDGIILQELNGKIINANAKILEMVEMEIHELRNIKSIKEISSPINNEEDLQAAWNKALSGGNHFFEWTILSPKTQNTIQTDVFLQKIDIGEKELILTNIRDISEKKAVEKLLLQEHNKVKTALKHEMLLSTIATILNSTDKFFDVLDNLFKIIMDTMHLTNAGFHSFQAEYTKEIEYNIDFFANQTDSPYAKIFASMLMTLQNNQAIYYSVENDLTEMTKDFLKSRNTSLMALIPIKISGNICGVLLFESDIIDPKTSKYYGLFNTITNMFANAWERYMLLELRIEAEKNSVETVKLLESSSKLASIGVMAGGITHEINQPLNAIKIMADGILFWNKRNPNLLPETFLDKITKITQAVNRIDSIIKHMRSFWMPRAQRSITEFSAYNALDNALDMINSQLSSHGIVLEVIRDNAAITLHGDIIHLEQIIINLCLNAMHALDKSKQQHKKIVVSIEKSEDKALFKIQDNGPGLPEGIGEKIFDPFYSTKQPGEGMGLGLAIVKQFVDNFKGEITAYNHEHGGAVFEVKI